MAINKTMQALLRALSYGEIEVESSRRFADLKRLDPMKIFYKSMEYAIYNGEHRVPARIYFPNEEAQLRFLDRERSYPVLLFFHGGGWVTESVENYDRVCARMAQATGHLVLSVEYRLAPEYRFPTGLEDCYAAAKAVFTDSGCLNTTPEKITVIGDSAGGNLAAAVCLLARDRGEFLPRRQILIYPALNNDYSAQSPYRSVQENGADYLLTARKMQDYLNLYASKEEDRKNPYFAPLLAEDLTGLPKTLILTAQYDPLRDEGEAYGDKMSAAGNCVRVHRIADALHGYFALGIKHLHVQESFDYMNEFLKEDESHV